MPQERSEPRLAKLFRNGRSQAVRLPADFRFEGSEVFVRRVAATGDVILSARRGWSSWDEYFAGRRPEDVPGDFLDERDDDEAQARRPFDPA